MAKAIGIVLAAMILVGCGIDGPPHAPGGASTAKEPSVEPSDAAGYF